MKPCRRRGVTLLEILVAVAISTILVAGAAAHFRTLRQANDTAHTRRETLQNARVAIDRMTRTLRGAKAIDSLLPPGNPDGSITAVALDDVKHVFALHDGQLLYGVGSATDLLAAGIESLQFQGYDAEGEVSRAEPENIEAVQITLSAAVGDTGDTLEFGTRVRLRNKSTGAGYAFFYASIYRRARGGLSGYWNALGAPDGRYASGRGGWGARFGGFDPGERIRPVRCVFVGFYLRHIRGGGFDLKVKRHRSTLVDEEYEDVFEGFDAWGWWWLDITDTRSSWSTRDIDNLSLEIDDSGHGEFDFDSVAILACYEEPQIVSYWADREGGANYPREWLAVSNAFGTPDGSYATGQDSSSRDGQSFRIEAPDAGDEILAVQVCINGYTTGRARGPIDIRCALPNQPSGAGTNHRLPGSYLKGFDRRSRQGDMLCDVTQDRRWTWEALRDLEIRIHVDTGRWKDLKADAVGWRLLLFPQGGGSGGGQWSEQ